MPFADSWVKRITALTRRQEPFLLKWAIIGRGGMILLETEREREHAGYDIFMNAADEAAENKCLFLTHFYTGQRYQIPIPQDVCGEPRCTDLSWREMDRGIII